MPRAGSAVRSIDSGCSARARSKIRSTIRSMRASSSKATLSSGFGSPRRLSSSSRWPRAIVTGVRSSCETLCSSRSSRSSSAARSSASVCTVVECLAAPSRMPDHREKHRRDKRHLDELAQSTRPSIASLRIVVPVAITTAAEHEPRYSQAPYAEAIEQGQADPDDVERDSLPSRARRSSRPGSPATGRPSRARSG